VTIYKRPRLTAVRLAEAVPPTSPPQPAASATASEEPAAKRQRTQKDTGTTLETKLGHNE